MPSPRRMSAGLSDKVSEAVETALGKPRSRKEMVVELADAISGEAVDGQSKQAAYDAAVAARKAHEYQRLVDAENAALAELSRFSNYPTAKSDAAKRALKESLSDDEQLAVEILQHDITAERDRVAMIDVFEKPKKAQSCRDRQTQLSEAQTRAGDLLYVADVTGEIAKLRKEFNIPVIPRPQVRYEKTKLVVHDAPLAFV